MHLNIINKNQDVNEHSIIKSFREVFNAENLDIRFSKNHASSNKSDVCIILLPNNGFSSDKLNKVFNEDDIEFLLSHKSDLTKIYMLAYKRQQEDSYNFYEFKINSLGCQGIASTTHLLKKRFEVLKKYEISKSNLKESNQYITEDPVERSLVGKKECLTKNLNNFNHNLLELLLLT